MGIILSNQEEIEEARRRAREASLSIILTCGVFDLLHMGHISSLMEARELGDTLFVAVNSDSSFSKQGKSHKLIYPEKDRLVAIAALEVVDYAFLFNEYSAATVLNRVHPDIFCKGRDYQGREFLEKRVAEELRIQVRFCGSPSYSSLSTSSIIQRIISQHCS